MQLHLAVLLLTSFITNIQSKTLLEELERLGTATISESSHSYNHHDSLNQLFTNSEINCRALQEGVNLVTFDPTTIGDHKTLIRLSYDNNTKIPHQVEKITPASGTTSETPTQLIKSFSDMTEFTEHSNTVKEDSHFVSFMLGSMFRDELREVVRNNRFVSIKSIKKPLYTIHLNESAIQLAPEFLAALNRSKPNYDKLLETYGTHILLKSTFGGLLYSVELIDGQEYTRMEVRNSSMKFKPPKLIGGLIAPNGEFSEGKHSEQYQSREQRTRYCKVIGGNEISGACLDEKMTQEWEESVLKTPKLIRATLKAIYQLEIPAVKKHRAELENATERVLLKSYLKVLQPQVENVRKLKSASELDDPFAVIAGSAYLEWNSSVSACLAEGFLNDVTFSGCTELKTRGEYLLTIAGLFPVYTEIAAKLTPQNRELISRTLSCQRQFVETCKWATLKPLVQEVHDKETEFNRTLWTIHDDFLQFVSDYPTGKFDHTHADIVQAQADYSKLLSIARLETPLSYANCDLLCTARCYYLNLPRVLPHLIFRENDYFLNCVSIFE